MRAGDPAGAEVHEVEAFGPVSTLIGYRDTADVIELAARGQGSLAGSVVTDDPDFAREVVLGIAPWHGRLLVLDADAAAESTGHGSPLPMLVHGGPGRAGGGEEMGGLRGVLHHMQRTAVQASPRDAGRGHRPLGHGRARDERRPAPVHASRWPSCASATPSPAGPRTVTLDDIEHFAEFTGDTFYAHTDEEAAAKNPFFDGRVAHGYLIVSFAAGLFVRARLRPGAGQLRHRQPALPDPALAGRRDDRDPDLQADQPRGDGDYGEVRWDAEVTNQDGTVGRARTTC